MAHIKLKNVFNCETGEVQQIEMTENEIMEIEKFLERIKQEAIENAETL